MARIYIRTSKGMLLLPLSGFSITPCLFIFEPLPTVYYNNAEFVGRRGGGRGGGGATTTLNFTSKLNPAEVKWRHGSFVRAFRFEPWYYRGGKRSNNIISITDFHAGLIIEPSVSIVTYDEGRRRRRRKGTFSSDHDVHLISVLIDDRDLYIYREAFKFRE